MQKRSIEKTVDIDGMHLSVTQEEGYVRCGDSILCLADFYQTTEGLERVKSNALLYLNAMSMLEEMVVWKEKERRMRR